MRNKNKMLWLGVLSLTFSLFAFNTASAKYNWADYFSRDEAKSIKKMTRKSVKNKLKKPDKSWKNILSGKVLKDGAISGDKIEDGTITIDKIADKIFKYSNLDLAGSIKASDIASNGCSSGQILKYNGSVWTCGNDDNTGSTLGNTVESSEITDGTIVNADINSSAGIEYSKLNLGANISSGNITDGTIVNADIDATAAIDYSKLNLGTNISSANITNDTIVNADINTAAAIDYSKLNLAGSILGSDLASNGCVANQILKYNGTNWVCGADENSGGTLGNSIESSEITDGTIVNADINSSAAIDSDKISFMNNTINLFDGEVSGDDSAEISIGTSCGSGDCASITKDKIAINKHNVTDYSVEMISSCTDGAEYSCSNQLDNQPVVRFYNEGSNSNILMGIYSGGDALTFEKGNGTAHDAEVRLGSIHAYGNIQANSASIGGGSGDFLQFNNTSAGAPASADCDDDSERGRMSIDTTNNRLYICNGATRGWDYVTLTD